MAFSFGFSGDDIAADPDATTSVSIPKPPAATAAFPVAGKPQLPPTHHDLSSLLARLPSKIAYDLLDVPLDDGSILKLPRRELWDVRVQLMAEDEGDGSDAAEGLGSHDVKMGVYEGGFKSWESSVDLVKVLASDANLFSPQQSRPLRVIEVSVESSFFLSFCLITTALLLDDKVSNVVCGQIAGLWDCTAISSSVPLGLLCRSHERRPRQSPVLLHRSRLQPNRSAARDAAQLHPVLGCQPFHLRRSEGCFLHRRRSRGDPRRGAGVPDIPGREFDRAHISLRGLVCRVRSISRQGDIGQNRTGFTPHASARSRDHLLPFRTAGFHRDRLRHSNARAESARLK